MATMAPIPYSPSAMQIQQENRSCGGCHESVDVDTGGVVVAFGNSLWHVGCFKCAKCGDRVSADTNLLLLSDGSPVCASCTYSCAVCKKPISDEAIMTGDESYHAACFTCKTCGRHIGELVFAKTTQGIYCMACHNERVARSRRHAEQRQNRSKSRRDGHRDKERLQERPSRLQLRDNSSTTLDTHSPPNTPGLQSPDTANPDAAVSYATKRSSVTATLQNSLYSAKSLQREHLPPPPTSPIFAQSPPSPTINTMQLPSDILSGGPRAQPVSAALGETFPLSRASEYTGTRRKSFDDGDIRPNGLLTPVIVSSSQSRPSSSAGRTIRADKRSSINPAVRSEWASQVLSDPRSQQSPTVLSPGGDLPNRQQPSDTLHDSDERSASPIFQTQRRGSPRSTVDSYYLTTSTPFLSTSQPQPPTENPIVQIKEPEIAKNHALQDQVHPALPSAQQMTSGRSSPSLPNNKVAVNGVTGGSVSHRAEISERELPKLPVELDVVEGQQDNREETPQTTVLALPPISFSESDSNFNDLFELGARRSAQGQPFVGTTEKPKEDARPRSRDENIEGGPSKQVPPIPIASSSPKAISSSPPPTKTPLPPSNNTPKRSTSLSRKMSSRKPVPKAIVLPDAFDADMTLDLDDSSNSQPSPGHSEAHKKVLDSAPRPPRRPASAGTDASSSHPPHSNARRSSDNAQSGLPLVIATPTQSHMKPVVTITDTSSKQSTRSKQDAVEPVTRRIKEALTDAQGSGESTVRLDRELLEIILSTVQSSHEKLQEMRGKFDRMRRTSQQVIDGLSVAQEEYDKELAARRDAEKEVTRLKVQLSGQAARLTELSAEDRKREIGEQMSRDMSANLDDLERDLSRIMAERDLAVAEVEELTASKMAANHGDGGLQRSLTHRFDNLKNQYKRELEPLVRQREALIREINELKEERNICLEETTALNARNEELAALNAQTARQVESADHANAMRSWPSMHTAQQSLQLQSPSTPKILPPIPVTYGSMSTSSTSQDERDEPKSSSNEKKLKWFKPSREPMRPLNDAHPLSPEPTRHSFHQLTVLRVARCEYCGDKMWGTQLRCTMCHFACHNRCVGQVTVVCSGDPRLRDDMSNGAPLQPSMFGRDLIEQVRAESVREHRDIPIIVEKCIGAVEIQAMDYEGVYRKTGGSAQSKAITQLFERGNYESLDLSDADTFNDVSSVTSVLKTYFRELPNPLLTNALHEAFVGGASIRDPRGKAESLRSLVYQLPSEHFHTLRYLMLHLHRIQLRSSENLMNARNLGVVFGPTLMRPSDPNREFSDMAGKALAIEWLIENALTVFREES